MTVDLLGLPVSRQDLSERPLDAEDESSEETPEEIQGGQEDRPPSLPRAVPQGQGKCVQEQDEARRLKVKEARKRREERQALKKEEMLKAYEAEDAPAEKASSKKENDPAL